MGVSPAWRRQVPQSFPTSTSAAPRRYATLEQAAAYLNCNPRTIRREISRGRLTDYRLGERMIRVDLDELDQVMSPLPPAQVG